MLDLKVRFTILMDLLRGCSINSSSMELGKLSTTITRYKENSSFYFFVTFFLATEHRAEHSRSLPMPLLVPRRWPWSWALWSPAPHARVCPLDPGHPSHASPRQLRPHWPALLWTRTPPHLKVPARELTVEEEPRVFSLLTYGSGCHWDTDKCSSSRTNLSIPMKMPSRGSMSTPHFESPKCICICARIMHKYAQDNRNGTWI
jgi:hypothetical protein